MFPVEMRLVRPFYLKMMGLAALDNAGVLWADLIRAGRGATAADVKELLAPDHWRPVVMGSWFSLKFGRDQVGEDLMAAIGLCRGTLTAPPLTVAAAIVIGEDARPMLHDYIGRDLEQRYGAAGFVAAVEEHLATAPTVEPKDEDRADLTGMLDIARRLRSTWAPD